jgi:hypothetical protein
MLERGRMRAGEQEEELLLLVEERVDSGPEASRAMLVNEMAPDELRQRLRVRP